MNNDSRCPTCGEPMDQPPTAVLVAENAALRAKLGALAEAADALHPADPTAWLEAEYDAFYAATGHWPPGRDRPAAMGGHDYSAACEAWCEWRKPRHARDEKALRDALAAAKAT